MKLLIDIRNLTSKKQLVLISSMLLNTGLGVAQIILSLVRLSLFLGFSGTFYIIIAFGKFFALERLLNIRNNESEKKVTEIKSIDRINYCTLICSLLFFSFGVVIAFFHEDPANYDLAMVTFIGILALIKFFTLGLSSIVSLKRKTGVEYYIKLMSLASLLISLALAQRAILYYFEVDYPSLLSGIGGIFFSLLATLVGLLMVSKARKQKIVLIEQNIIDSSYLREINIKKTLTATRNYSKKIWTICWHFSKKVFNKTVKSCKKIFRRN